MMIKRIALFFIGLSIFFSSCRPYAEDQLADISIDIRDATYQRIYDFQDRQMVDSLYSFLRDRNPTYRYVAAMAFASIKDTAGIDSLQLLLKDGVDEVRAAAAYALGQIGDPAAAPLLMQAFESYDTAGVFAKSNRAILEAIGKCGDEDHLRLVSTITTYLPTDTLLLEGQAWSLYRFALRDMIEERGTERMATIAGDPKYPVSARFIAANYLFRAANITIDSLTAAPLVETISSEPDARIRMALAVALGKAGTRNAIDTLLQLYDKENDYRVRCNILRAFSNFEYVDVQAKVIQALKDPNPHVKMRAAQYFVENGAAEDATYYWRMAKDSLPSNIQLELYRAANRHLPYYYVDFRNAINAELRRRFRQAVSPYEKAGALRALAEFGWNMRFIKNEGFKAEQHPVIRTTSVQALNQISRIPNYRTFFGEGYRQMNRELAYAFREAIESGDPGMMAEAGNAMVNDERRFGRYLDSLTFIDRAMEKLELPKEIETYNALQNARAFLNQEAPPNPQKPGYNHPIDWEVLTESAIEPRAILRTSKGNITVRLLPQIAPGSVANFIQLARDDYYDGKNFHRVVPNFVIQGGCPRGDGYGSLNYSIRSELPYLHYDQAGYVGMASAGNHTEGVQFFITHSPTPHLDGNYTIFGRVVEDDLAIVHQIQVGDLIEDIVIQ